MLGAADKHIEVPQLSFLNVDPTDVAVTSAAATYGLSLYES